MAWGSQRKHGGEGHSFQGRGQVPSPWATVSKVEQMGLSPQCGEAGGGNVDGGTPCRNFQSNVEGTLPSVGDAEAPVQSNEYQN